MFAYMEDFDLGLRIRAAGWRVIGAPGAVGVHLGSATYGHHSASQRRHGGFSRGYLLRRYGVLRGRAALRALLTEAVAAWGRDHVARSGRAPRPPRPLARRGGLPPRTPRDGDRPPHRVRTPLRLRLGVYGRGGMSSAGPRCPICGATLPDPAIVAPDGSTGPGRAPCARCVACGAGVTSPKSATSNSGVYPDEYGPYRSESARSSAWRRGWSERGRAGGDARCPARGAARPPRRSRSRHRLRPGNASAALIAGGWAMAGVEPRHRRAPPPQPRIDARNGTSRRSASSPTIMTPRCSATGWNTLTIRWTRCGACGRARPQRPRADHVSKFGCWQARRFGGFSFTWTCRATAATRRGLAGARAVGRGAEFVSISTSSSTSGCCVAPVRSSAVACARGFRLRAAMGLCTLASRSRLPSMAPRWRRQLMPSRKGLSDRRRLLLVTYYQPRCRSSAGPVERLARQMRKLGRALDRPSGTYRALPTDGDRGVARTADMISSARSPGCSPPRWRVRARRYVASRARRILRRVVTPTPIC